MLTMEILVLGNGFDLAHHLPTRYSDFLEFVRVIREILAKGSDKVNWGNLNKWIQIQIQTNLSSGFNTITDNKQYWLEWIGDNIWVEYFNKNQTFVKEGWIDFESEIASVIKSLDEDMGESNNKRVPLKGIVNGLSNEFLSSYFSQYIQSVYTTDSVIQNITFEEIRNRLLNDLNQLIRTL